jgi:hypothetical protein
LSMGIIPEYFENAGVAFAVLLLVIIAVFVVRFFSKKDIGGNHPAGVDNSERRKSERVFVQRPVTVRYNHEGNFEITGISRDLSNRGVFLYTESVIEVGAQVELTLTLPSESAKPISTQVRGRVVRVERTPATGIAVEFDKLTVMPELAH